MELEQIKVEWNKKESIGYSTEEYSSIYDIKKNHSLRSVKVMLTWDLVVAMVLTSCFIVVLQMLNLRTSNFWSFCMAILGLQHVILYVFQDYLIKKNSIFVENVSISLSSSIKRIKTLIWVYRIWPSALSIILYSIYTFRFSPNLGLLALVLIGVLIALGTALVSYFISGIVLKKQYKHLLELKKGYESISE